MDNITVVILVRMDSPIVQVAPMMDAGVTPNSITLSVFLRFNYQILFSCHSKLS